MFFKDPDSQIRHFFWKKNIVLFLILQASIQLDQNSKGNGINQIRMVQYPK